MAWSSLADYDAAITADGQAGVTPTAKLTNPATFTGANSTPFNFGSISGASSMEFIVEGTPSGIDAWLAVGSNSLSNLRFEQWRDTGLMGFTQLGVADYLFSPPVATPTSPTHVAYVWNGAGAMKIYLDGVHAATTAGVTSAFGMPTGAGRLGNNASGTEGMVGTIYRLTAYDEVLSDAAILRHSDAYFGIVRPPVIASFTASANPIFTPGSSVLNWSASGYTSLAINGTDVTALSSLPVSPAATTTFTITATNSAGNVTADIVLVVNPPPRIRSFAATPSFVAAGGTVNLTWAVDWADSLSLSPGGPVAGNGTTVSPAMDTIFTLAAQNSHGSSAAQTEVRIVHPAGHIVISELMAENKSGLADADGDFSDWIEIHNPTAGPVSLGGWRLTDDEENLGKWTFPSVTILPNDFLVIFASGKSPTGPPGQLHTNFRLDKGGEFLALVDEAGNVVHAFGTEFPAQDEDVSYGLMGGDPGLVFYMGIPTPGAPNDPTPPSPTPPQFSSPSGTFNGSLNVSLTTTTPGAQIRFTADGTLPTALNGQVYTSAIAVMATTRLRAVAVRNGLTSRVSGASYVRLAADVAGYTSPLPLLVIENFGAGVIPQKGWTSDGSNIQQVPRQSAFWAAFERQNGTASLTGSTQMATRIGIRGRGAFSSTWAQKPYSVEGLDENDGGKNAAPLGLPSHEDWILYYPDPDNARDPTLLFNTFAYQLSNNCGRYATRFRWVEVFINENGGDLTLADRRGVYALMEKVSRGRDRLDFEPLSNDGQQGGWLLNINRMDPIPETGLPAANGATQPQYFHTAGPNRLLQTPANSPVQGDDLPQQWNAFINFDQPNGYKILPAQRSAIEGFFEQFEDVLYDNALWRDPINGYRKYLDDRDFAEYFILNTLTKNGDGLLISLFPWKGDDNRLRMGPGWDYNWASYYRGSSATADLYWRSNHLWYARLFADPDFNQLFKDRWSAWRRGPMSNAAMDAIIDGQAAEITVAKAVAQGLPSATEWQNRLTSMKNWLRQRANWIDSQILAPPVLSSSGGIVTAPFQLTLTAPAGTVYFTTNGTDPRAPGGNPAAGVSQGNSLAVTQDTRLFARVRNGTVWSPPATASFVTDAVPPSNQNLVVSEINYHPADPSSDEIAAGFTNSDDFEFIELQNIAAQKVSLLGLRFARPLLGGGIEFDFAGALVLSLNSGDRLILAGNRLAFFQRYGSLPAVQGEYAGGLNNSGDTLKMIDGTGQVVREFTYDDASPWPLAADGTGYSLILIAPFTNPDHTLAGNWRTSVEIGGNPGSSDAVPLVAQPQGDDDGDGVSNLLEYAVGENPLRLSFPADPNVIELVQLVPAAHDDAAIAAETSSDMQTWQDTPPAVSLLGEARLPDGKVELRWRISPASIDRLFVRARVTHRP
ncbi:MAG: CotH kinase family protein [Verrucomicrobiales bacterium]